MSMTMERPVLKERRAQQHTETRAFLNSILDQKRWTATDLARHSDLAPSTLLRFLNDETNTHSLSFSTLKKVSEGSGFAIPRALMEAHGAKVENYIEGGRPATAAQDLMPTTIRLVRISALPEAIMPMIKDPVRVARPSELNGDSTAFAFEMPDDGLSPLIPEGARMYATKARTPRKGDIAMVTDTNGVSKVRLVHSVSPEAMMLSDEDARGGVLRIAHDQIKDLGVVLVISRH